MTMMRTMTDFRPSWDETWLSIAHTIGLRSRCSRAQIGAVVVSSDQRVCSTGYNGPAADWPYPGQCVEWCPRARGESPLDNLYDSCPAIHAEANALMYVDRSRTNNGTIYINSPPCMQCAKLISNSGIVRVVFPGGTVEEHRKLDDVLTYLQICGISITTIDPHLKDEDTNNDGEHIPL